MIDWTSVINIAFWGFLSALLILAILCIVVWLIGLVVRRRAPRDNG